MNKNLYEIIYFGILLLFTTIFPIITEAVTLTDTLDVISKLVNSLIPLILAVTVLIFFWGLAMYLLNVGSSESKGKGIHIMVMGIIAIFVMVSIWGIIGILQSTFQVAQYKPIIPQVITR